MPSIKSTMPETFPWLDGLRGIAAVWVLLSHIQILSGTPRIPILSWGALAVELFMLLSGFLMAHHYLLREEREPWSAPATWRTFWIRRFFRIAPLYYVLLAIALTASPLLRDGRNAVADIWPSTATNTSRYTDIGLANVLVHVTFAFGALPNFAFRTPLPDWSIGLEMQFYLAFPLIMLLVKRFGHVASAIAISTVCLMLRFAFKDFFHQFEMPSFLPMRLYVFLIGILLATSRATRTMPLALCVSVAISGAAAVYNRSSESFGLVLIVLGLFYLLSDGTLPGSRVIERLLIPVRRAFSGSLSRFLGDTSYGLYLVHLLVLIPVSGYLATIPGYVSGPAGMRFLACVLIVAPVSLSLAWLGHKAIELPGIRLGKSVAKFFSSRASHIKLNT